MLNTQRRRQKRVHLKSRLIEIVLSVLDLGVNAKAFVAFLVRSPFVLRWEIPCN